MSKRSGPQHNKDGVLAGRELPVSRRFKTSPIPATPLDETSLHIARLKSLHRDLVVNFRSEDLVDMSERERELLLSDCYEALGIDPKTAND